VLVGSSDWNHRSLEIGMILWKVRAGKFDAQDPIHPEKPQPTTAKSIEADGNS
jgi:hypothetical protein